MNACRLLLLGPPQLQRSDRIAVIPLKKAVALAAFLGVERRAFTREYLAAFLWPDHDQASALANLRRSLTVLREALADHCIIAEGDQIRMDPGSVEVDVDRFRELMRPNSPGTRLERLEEAAALYRGDFLEGFNVEGCHEFDEWQDAERERLRGELDELLGEICRVHLRAGRHAAALPVARRWLELDPLNEAAHRAIMEAHLQSGRADLARKQYTRCIRILGREGLEPDDRTRELHASIGEHRAAPVKPSPDPAEQNTRGPRQKEHGGRRGIRRIALLAIGILVAGAVVYGSLRLRGLRSDLSVAALQVLENEGELTGLRITLANQGPGRRKVAYAVVFSSDAAFRAARDYVAYAGTIAIPRNDAVTWEVPSGELGISAGPAVAGIPPGDYTAFVIVDPEERFADRSRANNRLGSDERFLYRGSGTADYLEVKILVAGSRQPDEAHPLRVFIGDVTESLWPAGWASFRVTAAGRYCFPLDDLGLRDRDGSGYGLFVVYDAGGDLEDLRSLGTGDLAGLYKEVADNVVYGPFTAVSGSPLYAGRCYTLTFAPPPFPPPDRYESDDEPEQGTLIDLADAPVRQYHTFDLERDGVADRDWFRIRLGAGETFTVETRSAGSRWESDTGIDLSDARGAFIRSGPRTSLRGTYAALAYLNDTGVEQVFRLVISPVERPSLCAEPVGEYVVEFRR